ncbi:MAG: insulinase family protein [Owenweeksia sp.]
MKKILALAFCLSIFNVAFAQLDRSVRPEAGDAPELDFGKYKLYELKNGLKVIVVEDHKLPRVSMSLVVDRDPILEGDKAGYVELAGEMLRQGTASRPKAKLDEEIDFMGASLFTSSSSVFASGLSKYNAQLMELMSDVALNPAFPQEEFDKLKKQMISGIESSKDNPQVVAGNVFNARLYGKDHPYGESSTTETVAEVELEDCKTYYTNYWVPNATYLAIVGDIKPKDAKKMAQQYFGKWARGNRPANVFEAPAKPDGIEISLTNKESAVQSVINMGNTIEMKPGDADEVKLELANQILGVGSQGRLFLNIREDKGFTYGAYSAYDSDRLIGEFTADASVRNEVTDSAVAEFLYEFNRIRTEAVSDEELRGSKNAIIGSFGRALERPQTVANFALNIQRFNLPDDYYETYLTRLEELTKEDVMATAKKYIQPNHMHITIVGKASEVADQLERFGKVNYYDDEGNPTTKPSMPVPADVTVKTVIDGYIKAKGGAENMKKVKDIETRMKGTVAGAPAPIEQVEIQKRPMMLKSTLSMQGMVVQETVFDGEKAQMNGMQGSKEITDVDGLLSIKLEAMMDKELKYDELGYKLKLVSMAMVDGKKAYVMEITDPVGEKVTRYYSAETFLPVKEEATTETPQGPVVSTTLFSDYREVNGVKYPYEINASSGAQKIQMVVQEIKVNQGIKDDAFKAKK